MSRSIDGVDALLGLQLNLGNTVHQVCAGATEVGEIISGNLIAPIGFMHRLETSRLRNAISTQTVDRGPMFIRCPT
ncbi:hypothetical protein ACP6C7_06190 [Mycolicibacterium septicum]|uniref:Uncharacterized protein n=1 Tax=Mycolicibacterium septicum TaxID=98668 RepID=A0ABW9LML0_9MYCO